MILFMPEHVEKILSGQKTETRRLWTKQRAKVGSIHKAKTRMLSTDYFALLKIERVYLERLCDISLKSIKAEGYSTREEYREVLEKANKRSKFVWDDDLVVWVVKFSVVEEKYAADSNL